MCQPDASYVADPIVEDGDELPGSKLLDASELREDGDAETRQDCSPSEDEAIEPQASIHGAHLRSTPLVEHPSNGSPLGRDADAVVANEIVRRIRHSVTPDVLRAGAIPHDRGTEAGRAKRGVVNPSDSEGDVEPLLYEVDVSSSQQDVKADLGVPGGVVHQHVCKESLPEDRIRRDA